MDWFLGLCLLYKGLILFFLLNFLKAPLNNYIIQMPNDEEFGDHSLSFQAHFIVAFFK